MGETVYSGRVFRQMIDLDGRWQRNRGMAGAHFTSDNRPLR
jgi:hypothetical protein